MSDPYIAGVTCLLHFNGTDGSTNFTNEAGGSFTASGNAQIDTAQSKFGGASVLFDGSGDYISAASSSSFGLSSDPFTIELWARVSGSQLQNYPCIALSSSGSFTANVWALCWNHLSKPNVVSFFAYNYSESVALLAGTTNINDGSWHHIAVTRDGNTFRLFIDGVLEDTETSSIAVSGSSSELLIGGSSTSFLQYSGHVDEFRITKATARYTANFTVPAAEFDNPPAPTFDYTFVEGSSGAFSVPGWVTQDPYASLVSRNGLDFGDVAVPVPLYEPQQNWLTTPANGTIAGIVTEGGIPVPFATVYCYFRRTGERIAGGRCDASGNFTFSGLDPTTPSDPDDGKYFVVALDHAGGSRYNALIYDRVVPS